MIRAIEDVPSGIDDVGQEVVGNRLSPREVGARAIVGGAAGGVASARTQGDGAYEREADVAGFVAEDDVCGGESPGGEGLVELVDVFGPHHGEGGGGGIVIDFGEGDSGEGDEGVVGAGEGEFVDDGAEVGAADDERAGVLALDLDLGAFDFDVAPVAVEAVLFGVVGVGFEAEEVGLVSAEGGHSPGDVFVPADQEERRAGDADAAGVEGGALDVEFVEQGGIRDRGAGLADEDGGAGAAGLAVDDPGVAELGGVVGGAGGQSGRIEAIRFEEDVDLGEP